METPNIFNYATSELSQDAFLLWLAEWANKEYEKIDHNLHTISTEFLRMLFQKSNNEAPNDINKVECKKQYNHMDALLIINNAHYIIIEDKVNAKEGNQQLKRYENVIADKIISKHPVIKIYLKTGNESLNTLRKIANSEWTIITRANLLPILKLKETKNNILNDFIAYLDKQNRALEDINNIYKVINDRYTSEAFLMHLDELFEKYGSEWLYVPNYQGGFLGMWWYWPEISLLNGAQLYCQIEIYKSSHMLLTIRIGAWDKSIETLRKAYKIVNEAATKFNLAIEKPLRFRPGESSRVAVVKSIYPTDIDWTLDNFKIDCLRIVDLISGIEKVNNYIS